MKYGVALLALVLAGCVEVHPPRNSRYSVDNTNLKPEELIKDTWVYRNPAKKPTDYQSFLFDDVVVYENSSKRIKKEDRPTFDAFGKRLTQKTHADFEKEYAVAAQPGNGVLEIHIEIVDIKPILHYINKDGYEAVRYDGTKKGSKFEMTCIDSADGETVLVISTLYEGEQYAAYENLADLGNVEKAYSEWSRFFKNRFDEAMRKREEPAPVSPPPSPKSELPPPSSNPR